MKIVILACFLGIASAGPVYKREGITDVEGIPSVGYEIVEVNNERQAGAALLGALGTALVPVVGTVVGPLLNNFASGFVNAITGNRPSAGTTGGTGGTTRPSFDAFMIDVPGAEGPFMLLTQDFAGAEIPFRSQIPSFNVSPYGKVHLRQPSQKSASEKNEKREEIQSETEDY